MPTSTIRSRALAACALASALLAGVYSPDPAGGVVNSPQPAFGGVAYGTSGHLGTVFRSGPSALLPVCTMRIGVIRNNETQGSYSAGIGTLGSVRTQIATHGSGGILATVTTAQTGASRLFAGAVAGTAFTAFSRASHNSSGYSLSGSTTLDNLVIGGRRMPVHPAANQKVTIPGIGYAVLNQQIRSHAYGTYRLTVVAAQINVGPGNSLGLPAGSITVSAARAALHVAAFRAGSGYAYGTQVRSGRAVRSGYTAPSYLPCGGTNGATTRNSTAAVSPPGLRAADVHSSARSWDAASGTTVVTRSEVSNVSLLGGAITASAITSQATARRGDGTLSRSSSGTTLSGLTIHGKPQTVSPPMNTVRSVPGVGTLYLHRVVNSPTGVHVYALQLVLSRSQNGLSKGTVITVGASYAAVAASGIL